MACEPSYIDRVPDGARDSSAGPAPSPGEARLRHALDAEAVDGEQAAAQGSVIGQARQMDLADGRAIDDVEVGPAEDQAGHVLDRQLDDAVELAAGSEAPELAGEHGGAPQIT